MTENTVIGGLDLPEKAEHTREKPIHTYRLTLQWAHYNRRATNHYTAKG